MSVGAGDEILHRIRGIIAEGYTNHEKIDDILREFIVSVAEAQDAGVTSVNDLCSDLIESPFFKTEQDYIRHQLIHSLIQEDDPSSLCIIINILFCDGQHDENAFLLMVDQGVFGNLLSLIKSDVYTENGLQVKLLEILCEMTKIQQLSRENMQLVDDAFVLYLLQLMINQTSSDMDDSLHMNIVTAILILSEQYMCFDQVEINDKIMVVNPLPNRIIQVLSIYGPAYRTFGESLILLLNRQASLAPQLLILKMLYLLFTTPATYEFFYTNDLYVLVDVILRNLVDLENEYMNYDDDDTDNIGNAGHVDEIKKPGNGQRALRHTYLRVLYHLLRNTQLSREENFYKREDLRRFFHSFGSSTTYHFAPHDETMTRLIDRCKQIEWLRDDTDVPDPISATSTVNTFLTCSDIAQRSLKLGMTSVEASISSLSVLDVSANVEKLDRKERPVIPPRRRIKALFRMDSDQASEGSSVDKDDIKIKPTIPMARRAKHVSNKSQSPV